ncbi:hypothetical protein ACFX13_008059 [Malus domestica]
MEMGRRQSTSYNINLIAIASFVQFKSRKENEKENISTGRVHGIGDKNSEISPQPLTQGDRYTGSVLSGLAPLDLDLTNYYYDTKA